MVLGTDPGGAGLLQGATNLIMYLYPELLGPAGPFIALGELVFQLVARELGLPDPMDLLFSQFSGRPTMEATLDQAKILRNYSSPTLKMLAMGASQLVHSGIPVSSPNAAPIFGAYFQAALQLEQGIRWGRIDAGTTRVEDNTLTVALHESGNPGHAGTATLSAIQQSYLDWQSGHPQGGGNPTQFFTAHVPTLGNDPASELVRGWWQKHQPTTPPPPPPRPAPPRPAPGSPIMQQWFHVCADPVVCANLSDDGLAQAQMLENIAKAISELPTLWAQQPQQCCEQIVTVLTNIGLSLHNIRLQMPPAAYFPVVQTALHNLHLALGDINASIKSEKPDFAGLDATIKSGLAPLHDIALKMDGVDLAKIYEQLKRLNDDQQVPLDWKRALLESKSLPPELSGLLQSTIWDTVAAGLGASLGHALGWGEAEIEGAAAKIGRFVLYPVAHVIVTLWKDFLKTFTPEGGPAALEIAHAAKTFLVWIDEAITGVFGFATNAAVEFYEAGLEGIDTSNEAGTKAATKLLLGRALEMGIGAHMLATLPEIPYFTKNLGLHEMAGFVAELAGFREVLVNTHRPLLYSKLGRPATHVFNRKFPTAMPPAPGAMHMWARRLMSDADARFILQSSGYADKYDATFFNAAYTPISPRALVSLMADQPFDAHAMREVLQDNAYSPRHVDFMLKELEYASTKNVRNSYVSEALTAYAHGVMPDSELHDILDKLGWSAEAKQFVTERAALQRRVTLAQKVEAQVVPLVAQGSITPQQGMHQLEAAGLQDWYAHLEITLATTKAEIHAAKLEATAEAREKAMEQRNLLRAAVAEFESGAINSIALTAALHALGIEPSVVASVVAVETAKQTGRQRVTYGKLMSAESSRQLQEQVAAIEQQYKDQLITLTQAGHQLHTLDIDPHEQHAMLARWSASLKKTPGASVLVNPITGQLETTIAPSNGS